jgi:hypothetical protein
MSMNMGARHDKNHVEGTPQRRDGGQETRVAVATRLVTNSKPRVELVSRPDSTPAAWILRQQVCRLVSIAQRPHRTAQGWTRMTTPKMMMTSTTRREILPMTRPMPKSALPSSPLITLRFPLIPLACGSSRLFLQSPALRPTYSFPYDTLALA